MNHTWRCFATGKEKKKAERGEPFGSTSDSNGQKPEPKYDGRPLHYWIEKFQKAETKKEREVAEQAVIAFGAEAAPALPTLMAMLADRSHNYRGHAANMICAMGPAAKEAVPELLKMLEEKPLQDPSRAIRILCAIGPDAKKAIPAIRKVALDYLAAVKCEDELLSYYLILNRYEYHRLGAGIVPLLIELLKEDNREITAQAARELSRLGPAARDALPVLKSLKVKPELFPAPQEAYGPAAVAPAAFAPSQPVYIDPLTQEIQEAIKKIESRSKK